MKLGQPDWSVIRTAWHPAWIVEARIYCFYLILNAYWEPLEFELPPVSNHGDMWRRWIDTSLDSPDDIVEWQTAPTVTSRAYLAGPRSVVALFSRMGDDASARV